MRLVHVMADSGIISRVKSAVSGFRHTEQRFALHALKRVSRNRMEVRSALFANTAEKSSADRKQMPGASGSSAILNVSEPTSVHYGLREPVKNAERNS